LNASSIDWFIDELIHLLIDWFIDELIHFLIDWFTGGIDLFLDCLLDELIA
jgi:hypothetical protein